MEETDDLLYALTRRAGSHLALAAPAEVACRGTANVLLNEAALDNHCAQRLYPHQRAARAERPKKAMSVARRVATERRVTKV